MIIVSSSSDGRDDHVLPIVYTSRLYPGKLFSTECSAADLDTFDYQPAPRPRAKPGRKTRSTHKAELAIATANVAQVAIPITAHLYPSAHPNGFSGSPPTRWGQPVDQVWVLGGPGARVGVGEEAGAGCGVAAPWANVEC